MARSPLSKYSRVHLSPSSVLEMIRPVLAYIERDGSFIATQLSRGDRIVENSGEQLWFPAKYLPVRYV